MTTHKEPSGEAVLAARISRAYPTLSAYSAASLAQELCLIERAQRRHAERCCNGDYKRSDNPRHIAQNVEIGIAEERAEMRIDIGCVRWTNRLVAAVGTEIFSSMGDDRVPMIDRYDEPGGPMLKVRLPGEAEAVAV